MRKNITFKAVVGATSAATIFALSPVAGATQLAQLPSIFNFSISEGPGKIATDGINVYFADHGGCTATGCTGKVYSVPVSGGAVTTLAQGLSYPLDVSYAASMVFFSGDRGGFGSVPNVGSVPVTGGSPTFLFSESSPMLDRWVTAAPDGSRVYFVSKTSSLLVQPTPFFVYGYPVTGVPAVLYTASGLFSGLAVDPATFFYALHDGTLTQGVASTGAQWLTLAPTPIANPVAQTAAGGLLLFANAGTTPGQGSIVWAHPNAPGNGNVINQGGFPTDIASDGACVYWTDRIANEVLAAPIGGGSPTVVYPADPSGRHPESLALDLNGVYFTLNDSVANQWTLQRVPKTGCGNASPLRCVPLSGSAPVALYSSTGSVTVEDSSDSFATPFGSGTVSVDTRMLLGSAGTPAAGLRGYEYRVDMEQAHGSPPLPCIESLSIPFNTLPVSKDLNGDGILDDCYVITDFLGTVSPSSVEIVGNQILINFGTGVCANQIGSLPVGFLASASQAPTLVPATAVDNGISTQFPEPNATHVKIPSPVQSVPVLPNVGARAAFGLAFLALGLIALESRARQRRMRGKR
jgi:hypothetical protein